jgi:YfiR/HmsC-like
MVKSLDMVKTVLATALLALLALPAAAPAAPAPMDEYSIKAAFLYNFAKFVEWPESSFAAHPETHRFCVYGSELFSPALLKGLEKKVVQGRRVVVLHPALPQELAACQIVFLRRGDDARLPEVLGAIGGLPVLLVGEAEGFAQRGGMINFVVEQEHVHFEINRRAAASAGLEVSSRLLGLAKIIDRGQR